jgi:hypothetical protein
VIDAETISITELVVGTPPATLITLVRSLGYRASPLSAAIAQSTPLARCDCAIDSAERGAAGGPGAAAMGISSLFVVTGALRLLR